MPTYIVVADAFTRFADKPTLWRYSDLLSALRRGAATDLRGQRFVAGQGLDDPQIDHLYCLALNQGLDAEFRHWRQWRSRPMVDMAACHKHRVENVLITEPLRLEPELFVSDLVLHAGNELMQDHLTGEHIQGMVLAEACRQMFLAVTELHSLRDFSPATRYFVINEMAIRYLAFAFPLPAQVRYRVRRQERERADRHAIEADIEVVQCDRVAASMRVSFVVFDAAVLTSREAQLARVGVEQCLSQLGPQATLPEGMAETVVRARPGATRQPA
jgi:hypothetical protein